MPVCPCEQVETLLGQGTLGLEMETDAPDVDTVLIAVGGGGLIGGIAAWYGGRTKIVAVEPDGAAAFALAAPLLIPRPAQMHHRMSVGFSA